MTVRKQKITLLGWEIKRRLAEKQMTQSEFCHKNSIPMSRLSEIISGARLNIRYRHKIIRLLQIEDITMQGSNEVDKENRKNAS